jgi:hypothetical protein
MFFRNCLAFKRERLVTGSAEGKVFVIENWWENSAPKTVSLLAHKDSVSSVQLSETAMISSGMDGLIKLFFFH